MNNEDYAKIQPVLHSVNITPKTQFKETFKVLTRNLECDAARAQINKFKKNPESVKYSAYHFIANNTHKDKEFHKIPYSIIDGGHRTCSMCECANERDKKYNIRAWLYSWADFDYDLDKVIEFYQLINTARPQSKGNILEANAFQSAWVKYFENKNTFDIRFERSVKYLSWTNIISSFINASRMMELKDIAKIREYRIDVMKAEFIDGADQDMYNFWRFLGWWEPIAENAKTQYGISTLYSVPFLTAGYLIWLQNETNTRDAEKIIEFPRFRRLSEFARSSQFSQFVDYLLFAINYRNTKRSLNVFGLVGQEP